MKVFIDPQINLEYTAFYIKGLYDFFGKHNVSFDRKYFKGLSPNRALKFIITDDTHTNQYVIDWGDDPSIEESDYEWCNYYGKINFNIERTPLKYHQKIIKLSPGFGVKIWNTCESAYYGIYNLLKTKKPLVSVKKFLSPYYKQTQHVTIGMYSPSKAKSNYIYSVNTLWNSDEWINNDDTVNQYRANFMNVCKSLASIDFEGGFVYSQIQNNNSKFKDLLIDAEWVPKHTYIDKTKASILVFNTPAWALCHGWKLGEYLALGKAIISTPILNELPAPLEHGKNIHIVSGEKEAIREAIELIIGNPAYRESLEKNAYEYYLNYICPIKSIKLLIKDTMAYTNFLI